MAISPIYTSDGSPLFTSDGSPIYALDGDPAGCVIPLPGSARPSTRLAPPPNVIDPAQFPPAGLSSTPIVNQELIGLPGPVPPVSAPTAYNPLDRLSIVADVLAAFVIPSTGTPGDKALVATQAIAAALYDVAGDAPGLLLWDGAGTPSVDLTAINPIDGRRYWANLIAYPDGAFYWVLGGLGGYGLEPYWRFGGLADSTLYVAYP